MEASLKSCGTDSFSHMIWARFRSLPVRAVPPSLKLSARMESDPGAFPLES